MGSVGLTFGSPTSGQGINVSSTVSEIVSNLEATETPYNNELTSLQAQDTVFSNLGTLLSALSTDVSSLTSPTGVLSTVEGSSSNTDVLSLTGAGAGAVAGSHTITVSQLAQTSSLYSDAVSSSDALSGSISIQVGSGSPFVVEVNPSDSTISGLAAAINAADAGVSATVVSGTAGDSLSIVSDTSGATGALTIDATGLHDATSGSAVTFFTAQTGQDAEMTVDGVPASSPSNTVSSVLPGVTFQLLATSATPVQVQITNDTSSVSSSLSTFVNDYNALIKALNAQEANTSSGSAEPLFGNPLVATMQEDLDAAITAGSGDSTAATLSSVGLSLNNDGTLSLDTNALSAALSSNFAGVVALFQGSGGVGQSLANVMNEVGNSEPDGLLTLSQSENASQEQDIQSTLATMQSNITTQQTQLTADLNAANETLQLIPTQLDMVNELYSAISGYGEQTNG